MQYLKCSLIFLVGVSFVVKPSSTAADVKEQVAGYPIIPESVYYAASGSGEYAGSDKEKLRASVIQKWMDEKEANKNGITADTPVQSLLMLVIPLAVRKPIFFKKLLDSLLALEPDLSYRVESRFISDCQVSALTEVLFHAPPDALFKKGREAELIQFRSNQWDIMKSMIELALRENMTPEAIKRDIMVAGTISVQMTRSSSSYLRYNISFQEEALKYLDEYNKKAAEIAYEELQNYLPRDLSRMGAEYIAPVPKPKAVPVAKTKGSS